MYNSCRVTLAWVGTSKVRFLPFLDECHGVEKLHVRNVSLVESGKLTVAVQQTKQRIRLNVAMQDQCSLDCVCHQI